MSDAQALLDQAYENGAYIIGAEDYEIAWEREAEAFRNATRCDLDVAYGEHPRAKYDVFWPEGTPKGLMVFVHGGYWKARSKSDWSHFAQGGLARGYAVALVGYPLAPEVRISEITRCVAQAIETISSKLAGPIVLVGHSAGGHLVARMGMKDVLTLEVSQRITRIMPISPVSDLRPLCALTLNDDLRLNANEAELESPALSVPLPEIDVSVVVGAEERPAFLDQANWLAQAWTCEHIVLPGRHHFDVIDDLRDPDSRMMRSLIPEPV